MKNKIIDIIKYLSLILIGGYLLILPTNFLETFHLIAYISVIIIGIYFFIKNIIRKKIDLYSILSIITSILLFIFIKKYPLIFLTVMPIIVGIYILIIGLAKLFTFFIYKNLPESRVYLLFSTIIHLTYSLLFIFFPKNSLKGCTILIGLYLITNGIEKIHNLINNTNSYLTQMPSIYLTVKPYLNFLKIKNTNIKNDENISDVEVLFHVRHSKRGVFGHADLIYKGYIYSYGNYDQNTFKIFDAIGEGVLFKTERNKYIEFCKKNNKTLFCFGLNLTKKELEDLDIRFKNIINNTYEWDKTNLVDKSYGEYLSKNLNIQFYKFNNGYYKNYFFLNYNCVKFIEEVISPKKIDYTNIMTPGILYSYLEDELNKKNSKIKYKNIY